MNRYTVWHTTGAFDGDRGFDKIEDAIEEFEHQRGQRGVENVELIDNADADEPKALRRWDAIQGGDGEVSNTAQ